MIKIPEIIIAKLIIAKFMGNHLPSLFYGTKTMYIFNLKYICVSETE